MKPRITCKLINPNEDSVSKARQIYKRIKVETVYYSAIRDENLGTDNNQTDDCGLSESSRKFLESWQKGVIRCPISILFSNDDDIQII
jgi:hypothetical protein